MSTLSARHSGLGIASFVLSLFAGLMLFAAIVVASMMQVAHPGGINQQAPATVLAGLVIIFGLALELIAIGLGIAALCQRDRRRIFSALGLVFAGTMMVIMLLLMLVGSLARG